MSDGCSCGKIIYGTQGQAERAARRAYRKSTQIRPYRCPEGQWHLTRAMGEYRRGRQRGRGANWQRRN